MPELIDISSGQGGLYPLLTASNFTTVALSAATASNEQSMLTSHMNQVVGTGKRALFVWLDDWNTDLRVCFYPVSGTIGVACPATTAWPPARLVGAWADGRGMGILRFGLDPGRNFFRLLSSNAVNAFWTDQAIA